MTAPAAPQGPTAAPGPPTAPHTRAALLAALEATATATERVAAKVRRNPGGYIRWLPRQDRFLRDRTRRKLIRAGNQHSGKTTVALYEVICRCLGKHPYLAVRRPPIRCWVVCARVDQSIPIQQKFVDLLPDGALANLDRFDPGAGFRNEAREAVFKNGSRVKFMTTGQDPIAFAGATLDLVLFDEPPPQRVFHEANKRLMRRGGVMLMSLTPINAGPMDWLQALTEKSPPVIQDIWEPLRPESFFPVGAREPLRLDDGTALDAAFIKQLEEEGDPFENPVTIHGEWNPRTTGQVFERFSPMEHVVGTFASGPGEDWRVCVGVDHGELVGKECAVLSFVLKQPDGQDRVFVAAEYIGGADQTVEADAEGILAMLARWSLDWSHVDSAWGDKTTTDSVYRSKGNTDLIAAIRKVLERKKRGASRVVTKRNEFQQVKTGQGRAQGSVDLGYKYLNQRLLHRGQFTVHESCRTLIKALQEFDGHPKHPGKDVIDALRYSLNDSVFEGRRIVHVPRLDATPR
jgi:phage terminase large subunit-like protein